MHGIELYLFNPPLSFVFLACPEIPALHGCMVNLQSKAEASHYYMKKFEDADWFIHVPCITLRNYLFDWTLSLLNWVGYFFVPNMGRGHTPYYKEKMRKLGPRELAKKAEMQRLMKWLDMEIDDFLNM
ncbi:MAG: hypothetical protein J4F29_24655 [Candidatus Latescibacteria bacterium]|nr:hypothetical protein [Candidatus Latescibacterota bacterium]